MLEHEYETAMRNIRRKIAFWLMLRQTIPLLTIWCFVWGTASILLRVLADVSPTWLLLGAIALPVALIMGCYWGLQKLPSLHAIRSALDKSGHCGGLLIAAEEREIGSWQRRLKTPRQLTFHWQWTKPMILFACSMLFVALGLLLPIQSTLLADVRPLSIAKEKEKLEKQIEVLKDQEAMKPERAETLQKELTEIAKEATANNPEKTFEAMDHLQEIVKKTGTEAGEESLQQGESLAKAETLADALSKVGKQLDEKIKADAMAELNKMLKQASAKGNKIANQLQSSLMKDFKNGKTLSDAQLKKIGISLKGANSKLTGKLKKLLEAQLIDAEVLEKMAKMCECNGDKLAKALKVCKAGGNCPSVSDLMANMPGNGGLNEGRGDAPIAFGKEVSEQGVKFKEQMLPETALQNLKESYQFGESGTPPVIDPSKIVNVQGGVLPSTTSGNGSAVQENILPQYRSAVQRYFTRETKKSAAPDNE